MLGVQLGHDVRAVGLHRLHADHEHVGDLLVGEALRDQLEHLAFAVGEQIVAGLAVRLLRLQQHLVHRQLLGDGGREVGVAAVHRLDGEQQLVQV